MKWILSDKIYSKIGKKFSTFFYLVTQFHNWTGLQWSLSLPTTILTYSAHLIMKVYVNSHKREFKCVNLLRFLPKNFAISSWKFSDFLTKFDLRKRINLLVSKWVTWPERPSPKECEGRCQEAQKASSKESGPRGPWEFWFLIIQNIVQCSVPKI